MTITVWNDNGLVDAGLVGPRPYKQVVVAGEHFGESVLSSEAVGRDGQLVRGVLLALAHAVPDVGYTQGMNFVCGWCLLVLDKDEGLGSRDKDAAKHALEECAFWLMRAVLQDVLPGYFAPGLAALRFDLDAIEDLLSQDDGTPMRIPCETSSR